MTLETEKIAAESKSGESSSETSGDTSSDTGQNGIWNPSLSIFNWVGNYSSSQATPTDSLASSTSERREKQKRRKTVSNLGTE